MAQKPTLLHRLRKVNGGIASFFEGFAVNVAATHFTNDDPAKTYLWLGMAALLALRQVSSGSNDAEQQEQQFQGVVRWLEEAAAREKDLIKVIDLLSTEQSLSNVIDRERTVTILKALRGNGKEIRALIDGQSGRIAALERLIEQGEAKFGDAFDALSEIQSTVASIEEKVIDLQQTSSQQHDEQKQLLFNVISLVGNEKLDPLLDRSRDAITEGLLDGAEAILDYVASLDAKLLTPRLRYRLHAQRGQCLEARELLPEAAEQFLVAHESQPDDPAARMFRCLALRIKDDASAEAEVDQLVLDHPDHVYVWGAWLQQHSNLSLEEARSRVPAKFHDEPDVLVHFTTRAATENRWDEALHFARQAMQEAPGNFHAMRMLGEVLVDYERFQLRNNGRLSDRKDAQLQEALTLLTEALQRTKLQRGTRSVARLLRAIAVAKDLLNDDSARIEIEKAYEEAPDDPPILVLRAEYLAESESLKDLDAAIRMLEKHLGGANPDQHVQYTYARLKLTRGKKDDAAVARDLLTMLYGTSDLKVNRLVVFVTLVRATKCAAGLDASIAFCSSEAVAQIPASIRHTALAEVHRRAGKEEESRSYLNKATASLPDNADPAAVRYLAQELTRVREYKLAYPIWKRVIGPTSPADDACRFVEAGYYAEEHAEVLDWCERFRSAKLFHPLLLDIEMAILSDCHSIDRMKVILNAYLQSQPEGDYAFQAQLRLYSIELQTDPDREVQFDKHFLVPPEKVTLRIGLVVVGLLRRSTNPIDAINYCYTLLRRFFIQEQAHLALIGAFRLVHRNPPEPPISETVQVGFGVLYRLADSNVDRFFIIEDENVPARQPDLFELDPNEAVAKSLIGLRAGDTFGLMENGENVQATIMDVRHKTILRFQDCISRFNKRFRESDALMMHSLRENEKGEPDFSPIIETVNRRGKWIREVERLATQNYLPMSVVADMMGSSVLRATEHFVASSHLIISSSHGNDSENDAADALLQSAEVVVCSPSALATLFVSRLYKHIGSLPFRLIVPWSALFELNRDYEDAAYHPAQGGILDSDGERLSYRESKPEDFAARAAALADFRTWLSRNAAFADGVALLHWPAGETRTLLNKAFTPAAAEAIAIGRSLDVPLWDDDLIISSIYPKRVWSQAVLEKLAQRGVVSGDELLQSNALLLLCGFRFVRFSSRVLVIELQKSGWDLSNPRVRALLREAAQGYTSPKSVAVVLGNALFEIHTHPGPTAQFKSAFYELVANVIQHRPDGRYVFDLLIGFLGFQHDEAGMTPMFAVRYKTIRAWGRKHDFLPWTRLPRPDGF